MIKLARLPVESGILVDLERLAGAPGLTERILQAFNQAYADGETGIAAALRRALETAAQSGPGLLDAAEARQALGRAELWVEYVEARDAYRRASEAEASDPAELEAARAAMLAAYRRWSEG